MKKKTIQEMRAVASERDGFCLSGIYVDARTPLIWRCSKGHEWSASPVNVTSRNSWCPYCVGQRGDTASIEYMKKVASDRGGKCLSDTYKNSKTKLLWECAKGHLWEAMPLNVIHKMSWCPECHHPKIADSELKNKRKKAPNGFWDNLANCKSEALKYKSRAEWMRGSPISHRSASKNGWLDECASHMIQTKMPDGYWTLDRCKEYALKYRTKVEWRATHKTSFSKANKEGWLEECCKHMETKGLWFGPASILEILIAYDIPYSMEHRFKEFPEVARRPFDFYLPAFNLIIEFHGEQHLVGWGRRASDAKSIQERDAIKKNWALENRIEFLEIWQRDVASKKDIQDKVINTLKRVVSENGLSFEFRKRSLTSDEIKLTRNRLKWTLDSCIADAKKYKTIKDWSANSPGGYQAAFKKGWLESCSAHMVRMLAPKNYWTIERCIEDAKQYKTKTEWSKAKPSGYSVAVSKGWMAECTKHMTSGRHNQSKRVWTYEKCAELAKKCKSRVEFKKLSPSAYTRARVEGWLDDCCSHMR